MVEIYNKLIEKISKDRVQLNEPMSKHTSFKIGGNADIFVKVENIEELRYTINTLKESKLQYIIIGNGSNILVKDRRNKRSCNKIKF